VQPAQPGSAHERRIAHGVQDAVIDAPATGPEKVDLPTVTSLKA